MPQETFLLKNNYCFIFYTMDHSQYNGVYVVRTWIFCLSRSQFPSLVLGLGLGSQKITISVHPYKLLDWKLLLWKLHDGKLLPCKLHNRKPVSWKLQNSKLLSCKLHDEKPLPYIFHNKTFLSFNCTIRSVCLANCTMKFAVV